MDDFTPDRTDPRLARALRARLSDGSAACPDAEQLAAWTEGALGTTEAARIEAHLADCARCQSLVSALAATEDAAPAAAVVPASAPRADVIAFPARRPMKWVLPLAAGLAATLVIWTMTRDVVPDPDKIAATNPAAAESSQARSAPVDSAPVMTPAAPPAQGQAGARPTLGERRPAERDAAKVSADQSAGRGVSERRERQQAADKSLVQAAPPPPPPPAMTAPPPPAARTIAVPPAAAGAAATGLATQSVAARLDAVEAVALDAKPIAQFTSAAVQVNAGTDLLRSGNTVGQTAAGGAGGGRAGGAGRGGGGGRAGGAVATAPVRTDAFAKAEGQTLPAHWRIFVGNRVERSIDNGLTWTPVKLEPGLPAITNGSAPAGQICWLVGGRGLVLVSADGTAFTRVAAPAEVDLSSVQAQSERQATVTTADGRTFTTVDGGKSWR